MNKREAIKKIKSLIKDSIRLEKQYAKISMYREAQSCIGKQIAYQESVQILESIDKL